MRYTQFYKLKEPEGPDGYDVEDFNMNAEIIDKTLNELSLKGGTSAIEHTVTVPEDGWVEIDGMATQTVNVPDVHSNSIVMMGVPMNVSSAVFAAIAGARINAIAQDEGTITLRVYQTKPNINISLSFVVI